MTATPTPVPAQQPPRILVVEDERIVARDLENTLTDLGYQVVGKEASGPGAIAAARANLPNAILMDIRLQGPMDGIEAAGVIQAERDVPIIYLTAHADVQTLARAQETRPFGYLVKPWRGPELRCAIEIALHRHEIDAQLRLRERSLTTTLTSIEDGIVGPLRAEPPDDLERRVIERTRQLEIANRELEAFSYSVAHDLRAPLRGIDGFSQALIEDHAQNLGPVGYSYLTRIRESTGRMAALIEDLLRLSRTVTAPLDRQRVDLSRLARRLLDDLAAHEPDRHVETRVQPGMIAEGDAALIRIVLENLFANAWKFSARANPAAIEVGARRENDTTVFYIRDNGVGFVVDRAHRLFSAFQRFHSASDFEGNGIGLAIVQRIINRHGGRIWAESTVGEGATFHFSL